MTSADRHEEREAIRAVFAEFARREVAPGAADRDRTGAYPADLVARIGQLDGMGISVPAADGGLGLDTVAQLIAIEEIAYADASLASIYTAHYLGMEALRIGGGPQRERWLGRLASGRALAGFALTEPGAGSDISSMTTTARLKSGSWILHGQKTFISNARQADVLVVFARSESAVGIHGISAFALSAGTQGVTFSKPQSKSGLRSAPTYSIYIDHAQLPGDAIVGERGRGGVTALQTLNAARIDIAAMANGIGRRALDLAVRYATERHQFGRSIREFQAVGILLGRIDAEIQAARLAAAWAAERRDAGHNLRRPGSIAKYVATEACFRAVDASLQIHGGAGYLTESEIERLYRDCRVLRIYEGTSQIQLLTIARQLVR